MAVGGEAVITMVRGFWRCAIVDAAERPRAAAAFALLIAVLLLHLLALQAAGDAGAQHGSQRGAQPRDAIRVRSVEPPTQPRLFAATSSIEAAPVRTEPRPAALPILRSRAVPRMQSIDALPLSPALLPAAVEAPPRYPTALPPSTTLRYALRRGSLVGSAELRWQREPERYAARFDGDLGGTPLPRWSSAGSFDAAGVAPDRFVAEGRRRASARAVNFQRDAGTITFSGPTVQHALAVGAQDRLSWMAQLAGIAAARAPAPGETIVMQVAGPRGDAELWRFDVIAAGAIDTDTGPIPAMRLVREPRRRYDTRVEVWLDPARHHWPVRALLGSADDGRDALEMLLLSAEDDSGDAVSPPS